MDKEIGEKYNMLTCLRKDDSRKGDYYFFKCDCGNVKSMKLYNVKNGYSRSCGCLRIGNHTKHNGTGTRLYTIWKSMRQRCNNPNIKGYYKWGGKGIRVCKEWDDFKIFREWSLENGYNDSLTIDRIDNEKGYCPNNCRWATYEQQAENTKNSKLITVGNVTHCYSKWERLLGMKQGHLSYKAHRGIDVSKYIQETIASCKERENGI